MTSSLIPFPNQFNVDTNGNLLIGGQLWTFIPNTDDPKATYSDVGLTALNQNPIIFNGYGRLDVYGTGGYDFLLEDENGNEIDRGYTASYLQDDAISDYMKTVNLSPDITTAQDRLGLPQLETQWAANVSRLTGPTGPQGTQGLTGPTGPQGSSLSGSINVQDFTNSGTWTKPTLAIGIVIIEIFGAGGAGTDASDGGGGGSGGYFSGIFIASQIANSVAITIGTGGLFVSLNAGVGASGGSTSFGSYLVMSGGAGGPANATGIPGISGSITSASITPLMTGWTAESQPGYGGSATTLATSSIFGGSGGGYPGGSGSTPGGGGGINGGNGGNGRILVTSY